MEWAALGTTAGGSADYYRHGHPRTPVHLACHVDDLVKTTGNEVNELHLRDGSHPHQRRSDRGPDDGGLGHGRIDHALRSELFQQARADFEGPTVCSHIFAQEEYGLVALHLFTNGLPYCF